MVSNSGKSNFQPRKSVGYLHMHACPFHSQYCYSHCTFSCCLGTHDIQAITIINATSSRLCIKFDLVEGWIIEAAYIYLICDDLTIDISSFSIILNSTFSNTIHSCFSNISVCTGKVLICGEESPDLQPTCIANPAAVARVSLPQSSLSSTAAVAIACGVGGALIIVVFVAVLGMYHLPYNIYDT